MICVVSLATLVPLVGSVRLASFVSWDCLVTSLLSWVRSVIVVSLMFFVCLVSTVDLISFVIVVWLVNVVHVSQGVCITCPLRVINVVLRKLVSRVPPRFRNVNSERTCDTSFGRRWKLEADDAPPRGGVRQNVYRTSRYEHSDQSL